MYDAQHSNDTLARFGAAISSVGGALSHGNIGGPQAGAPSPYLQRSPYGGYVGQTYNPYGDFNGYLLYPSSSGAGGMPTTDQLLLGS
jgi:hypothetical protein